MIGLCEKADARTVSTELYFSLLLLSTICLPTKLDYFPGIKSGCAMSYQETFSAEFSLFPKNLGHGIDCYNAKIPMKEAVGAFHGGGINMGGGVK